MTIGYDAYGDPMSTSMCRAVCNNINHIADQRGSVLVMHKGDGSEIGLLVGEYADSTWTPGLSFGPFPLRLDANNVPYPIRVRVGGASVDAGRLCQLRIGCCPVGMAEYYMKATTIDTNVIETVTFTDDVPQWRAGLTAYYPILNMSESWVVDATDATYQALDSVTGTYVTKTEIMATIEVWGWCESIEGVWLTSAIAAEFVGSNV